MREGNAERGFTLLELMAVVAILAILAAVVIPNFMQQSSKAKGRSEVTAMFAEIAQKQEQFKLENGKYMGDITDSAYEGSTTCPATVPTTDYNFGHTTSGCLTTGSAWRALRIDPTSSSIRCQYTIEAGVSGSTLTPATGFKNSQGSLNTAEPSLAGAWWTVHAVCDESGNGGTNAEYYQSSVDRKIQSLNEGS